MQFGQITYKCVIVCWTPLVTFKHGDLPSSLYRLTNHSFYGWCFRAWNSKKTCLNDFATVVLSSKDVVDTDFTFKLFCCHLSPPSPLHTSSLCLYLFAHLPLCFHPASLSLLSVASRESCKRDLRSVNEELPAHLLPQPEAAIDDSVVHWPGEERIGHTFTATRWVLIHSHTFLC